MHNSDDSHKFLYEYGTDLHWLWGWGDRLKAFAQDVDGRVAVQLAWMHFRPDHLAADALTRLGVVHPTVIKQVQDYLDFAEEQFRIATDQNADADAEAAMVEAFADLADRILRAAEAIPAFAARTDTKTDTGKKPPKKHRMNNAAYDVVRLHKAAKKADPGETLKNTVENYVLDHPHESADGLYRRLTENRAEWEG